jgi:UTP--glucose-1-phosphate uridylyltransferase
MSADGLARARAAMAADGIPDRAIAVFESQYRRLEAGETGLIHEADIEPLTEVQRLDEVAVTDQQMAAALDSTVLLKLNGGLGTSVGLDKAKSLLPVRGDASFLDVIVGQVLAVRNRYGARLPLVLMNSFRTRDDTLAALAGYPTIEVDGIALDFLQNREPKLRADDLTPVSWPQDPSLEWCPPGHGDIYTALATSGMLQALLDRGFRYASVSNSDNLGAAPDPRMAGWFAASGVPYAAEVCRRTSADVKGGYLVVRRRDGRLILRETAQTPDEDAAAAKDIERHRFFHTNNLWFDLEVMAGTLDDRGGVLGLPLIRNMKTVDPTDPNSTPVIQIESAMGAAVEVFDGAVAIEVPRSRFLPVKTTNDLLLVRSDVYLLDSEFRLTSAVPDAPAVDLDPRYYQLLDDFDRRFPAGPPSLARAVSLRVRGDWTFGDGVSVIGAVTLDDAGSASKVGDGAMLGPESQG